VSDETILEEVRAERRRQDEKWGQQDWPDGTGAPEFFAMREYSRLRCQASELDGTTTWEKILTEEYFEALAEADDGLLRAELIQCQAVLCAWVGAIDRRRAQIVPSEKGES
jgi:hypothetical protein